MNNFHLGFCSNLPIVTIDSQRYLVDTLCPNTEVSGALMIDGIPCDECRMVTGGRLAAASDALGTRIDGILGANTICNYYTIFDYRHQKMAMTRLCKSVSGLTVHQLDANLRAVVSVYIGGEWRKILLATGFDISYVNNISLDGDTPVLVDCVDQAALGGTHRTDVYNVNAVIGTTNFNFRVGRTVPACVKTILAETNVDGVSGFDIFSNFKVAFNCFGGVFTLVS